MGRLRLPIESAAVLTVALVFAACSRGPLQSLTDAPIKIGVIAPVTSGVAANARSVVEGAQLAVDEANADKGIRGRRLSVVIMDDHGVPDEAAKHLEQLAGEGAVAVVGPVTDEATIAAAGVAARLKIVLLSPGATATLPYGGHFVFRTALPARMQAAAMAEFLAESLNLRRIAVSHDSNEYGTMVAQAFEEGLVARGIALTNRRLYRDGETDFARHVRGALAEQAQALFVAGYPDEAVLLLRQVRAVSTTLVVAGSDALYSQDILDGAGAFAEGFYVPTGFIADVRLPVVRTFVSGYEKKYGRAPDQFAAQAYDAVRVIVHAVRRSGPDRQAVRDTIATLKRFPGATGDIGFDRWGNPAREIVIARVKGGAFTPGR